MVYLLAVLVILQVLQLWALILIFTRLGNPEAQPHQLFPKKGSVIPSNNVLDIIEGL